MNSCRQGFKKLVLGTTLMCCAGMSTVEAGPWDWLSDWLYENRGKVCLFVGTAATGLTCYLVFWKRHHAEPSGVENEENLLQLEGDTLAIQEREISLEEEVQNEEQDLAVEQAKGQLEDIAKQAIQRVLALQEGIKIRRKEEERAKWDLLVVRLQKKENLKAAFKTLQKDLTQYRSQLSAVSGLVVGNNSNTSPRKQNIQSKLSDFITSQQAAIQDLSQTVKNNSETMKSQQETIQGLVRIVQNGEIIMLEILKKCNSPFDASSVANYRIDNIDQLDEENVKFIASEPGKQLAIITQNQGGSETVVAVCNAEKSLYVLKQCLQGVEGLSKQKEEAALKVEVLSKNNKALQQEKKAAEQAAIRAEQTVTQIQAEKENLTKANESLEKANNDINKQVEALKQETNKVAEENRQLTAKTQQAEQRIATLQSQNKNKTLTKQEEDAIITRRISSTCADSQLKESAKRFLGV